MDLLETVKIFKECKEINKECSMCLLNKVIIETNETTYDICDCLIKIEKA